MSVIHDNARVLHKGEYYVRSIYARWKNLYVTIDGVKWFVWKIGDHWETYKKVPSFKA